MKTLRVLYEGRVQGVGFRYYTRREAQRLAMTGWVRNLADGRVEAVLQGSEEQLSAMLRWLKTGSPLATVDSIVQETCPMDRTLISFEIVL